MSAIQDRLTQQLRDRGVANPEADAVTKLKSFGILDGEGNLTEYGKLRDAMTPGERAIDRAVTRSGHSADEYIYDAGTNRATLKNAGRRRAVR